MRMRRRRVALREAAPSANLFAATVLVYSCHGVGHCGQQHEQRYSADSVQTKLRYAVSSSLVHSARTYYRVYTRTHSISDSDAQVVARWKKQILRSTRLDLHGVRLGSYKNGSSFAVALPRNSSHSFNSLHTLINSSLWHSQSLFSKLAAAASYKPSASLSTSFNSVPTQMGYAHGSGKRCRSLSELLLKKNLL